MQKSFSALWQNKSVQNGIEVFLMGIIAMLFCFEFKIAYNEMDIIPYARSVYNPAWLANDWYLSLKIPYRYLFSYGVGFFVETFGVVKTIFVGRLITYLLFAFAFSQLLKHFIQSWFLRFVLLIIYLQFFQFGIGGAGEWMVGGLDTKVFAYSFALLSLSSFLQNKYKWGLFYAGLALSFHLLVGAYNLVCLAPILLLEQFNTKNYFLNLLKSSYLFVLSGAVGLFAIYSQFSGQVNKVLANQGWNIYVNVRVPHHVLPHFSAKTIAAIVLFSVINLYFLRSKIKVQKSLAIYGLSSVAILLFGVFVFQFLDHQLLKYYFFRTSNVVLPLTTLVLLTSFLYERFKEKQMTIVLKPLSKAVLLLSVLLILQFQNLVAFVNPANYNAQIVLNKSNEDVAMMNWIKQNTPENAVFLIPPYFEQFYIHAERAVFVSWKNSPQNGPDILEWSRRLKLFSESKTLINTKENNEDYMKLDAKSLKHICLLHPEIDFVVMNKNTVLSLKPVFVGDKHLVFLRSDFVN